MPTLLDTPQTALATTTPTARTSEVTSADRPAIVVSHAALDGRRLVAVEGELTVHTGHGVRRVIEDTAAAAGATVDMLIVDLRQVTRLDAAGLMAVTAPAMVLRRGGCRLRIELPEHAEARRIADLAGVGRLLAAA